ncbi:hypothetical protein JCM8097_004976 [Rhodosporidiobolus ruineniae]
MPDASQASTSSSQSTQDDPAALEADPLVPMLACKRRSPRPCVNQALVDALAPLRTMRFLQYGPQHEKSIAYATAISVIIGTPFKIETKEQARRLPKVGEKIVIKIDEFLRTGKIQDSLDVVNTHMYKTLSYLQSFMGIGHTKSMELYNQGIHNEIDLMRAMPGLEWQLKYHADLQEKIPRAEVESIRNFIQIQIDRVKPGAHLELCGGYRRGKEFSNDVDILITYPHKEGEEKGVLDKLIERLRAKGLIPPSGVSNHSSAATFRTIAPNRPASAIDALDKALIVFRHPANDTNRPRDKYRRVDLVVANWESWGTAVIGWTGSTQFERDLRRHAKTMNIKFDSGGMRKRDTDEVVGPFSQEKDVFRYFKLDYIPPEERNADP